MRKHKDLYRAFDTGFYSLSERKILSYSTYKGLFRVLSGDTTEVLSCCKQFRMLERHAKELVQKRQLRAISQPLRSPVKKLQKFLIARLLASGMELPLPKSQLLQVQSQLDELVRDGFLISKTELENSVLKAVSPFKSANEAGTVINSIGIPTRNRSEHLVACVKSLLEGIHLNNRTCAFYIVDDSDENKVSGRTRRSFQEICKKNRGVYKTMVTIPPLDNELQMLGIYGKKILFHVTTPEGEERLHVYRIEYSEE